MVNDNISFVINHYPSIGGAEFFVKELSERLVSHHYHVDVFTGNWKENNKENEVCNGVNVYRSKVFFENNVFMSTLSYTPFLILNYSKKYPKRQYSLLHTIMNTHGSIEGAMMHKLYDIPHIVTVQALYFEKKNYLKRIILKKMAKCTLESADIVHVISNNLNNIVKSLGISNTCVIPNAVNTDIFKPFNANNIKLNMGYSINDKIIITTSRLTKKNGIDVLIKSFQLLRKNNNDVFLLIIGSGEEKKEIIRLINDLNLNHCVKLLGDVPFLQIPDYLNISDVFVRPSYDEGFGSSFIEAMACNIPVIGTNVGGIPDIISNNYNGILVNPGDVLELSNKLEKMLDDEQTKITLAINGYDTVYNNFSWGVVYNKIVKMYDEVLSSY